MCKSNSLIDDLSGKWFKHEDVHYYAGTCVCDADPQLTSKFVFDPNQFSLNIIFINLTKQKLLKIDLRIVKNC